MSRSMRQSILRFMSRIAESGWFAYATIALLQAKVMLWIWEYRDLTSGDTSYYYSGVFTWLSDAKVNIANSPLYTIFLAALHKLIDNPFWVLTVAQMSIAACASLLALALLRRLLPKYLAWVIAAWWTLLPINFDTLYSVHLFSALFPLAIFVIAAYSKNIYGRGIVLGGLLLTAVLVRIEYGPLFLLWLFAIAGYEIYMYRRQDHPSSPKAYLSAYGLPILLALLIIGAFSARSAADTTGTEKHLESKQSLTFCQTYAYNRKQQEASWKGNPHTECQSLLERDFGRANVTFSQAFLLNPRAMLELIWWNIKLIPSGTQLALFDYYSGGPNPDVVRAKHSPLVWLPFLLILGLGAFAAMVHFIVPCLRKQQSIENAFAWLLMLSTALLVLGIMMMILPRPSYMFPYTLFIMALTGLGLHGLLDRMRISSAVKAWVPLAGILLILFVPSYYDADYVNHFGYKGQRLRQGYDRVHRHITKTPLNPPAVLVIPVNGPDYDSLCNYLGLTCLALDMEGAIPADKMPELASAYPEDFQGKNVYIFYLEDMIWNIASMAKQKKNYPLDYVELHCFSRSGNIMTCKDGIIDLDRGIMNDGSADIPLRAALFVNDGYVIDRRNYRTDQGYFLQFLMRNNKVYMILVADERLFRTNFNQQYLLGNYDRRYFEEVYNDSPPARVLKLKKADADDGEL